MEFIFYQLVDICFSVVYIIGVEWMKWTKTKMLTSEVQSKQMTNDQTISTVYNTEQEKAIANDKTDA